MALGLLLVAVALGLLLWNLWEARQAQASVEELLPQVLEEIQKGEPVDQGDDPAVPDPVKEIGGQRVLGCLSVPRLGLTLPVLAQWNDSLLRMAPCRYAGGLNTGDLVIAGHNYRRHFASLSKLVPEDQVEFTDLDGVSHWYQVEAIDVLEATAVEERVAGDYPLTLFTCTYGGKNRLTVRCGWLES